MYKLYLIALKFFNENIWFLLKNTNPVNSGISNNLLTVLFSQTRSTSSTFLILIGHIIGQVVFSSYEAPREHSIAFLLMIFRIFAYISIYLNINKTKIPRLLYIIETWPVYNKFDRKTDPPSSYDLFIFDN